MMNWMIRNQLNDQFRCDTITNIIFNYCDDASRLIIDDTAKMLYQIQVCSHVLISKIDINVDKMISISI